MIIKNGKNIETIYKGSQAIETIYKGTLLVYESFKILIASVVPPLTLLKSGGKNLVDYKVYGDSVQEGKNLIKNTFTSQEKNGITWTANADGTVIANGTATTDSYISISIDVEPVTMCFSACTETGSSSTFRAIFYPQTDKANYIDTGDGVIATPKQAQKATVQLTIYSGYTANNLAFKPQLELGTVKTEWQSSVISPSNPIEVESVGDKTNNLLTSLVKGVRLDFTTGEEKTDSEYASTDYIPINFNVNPNYYLSGLVNTINSCMYAYNKDKLFLGRTAGQSRKYISLTKNSFTSGTAQGTGDIAYLRVSQYVTVNSTGSIDDIDNAQIQLEEGTVATDYEPYGYKIPVKASGRNLFNINNVGASSGNYEINDNTISVLSDGKGTYRQVTYNKKSVQPSTKYYLNFQYEVVGSGTARISVYQYDENNNFITDKPFYSSGVLETKNNTKYIEVRVYANEATVIPVGEGVIYSNIQIEEGTVATDYEPYVEPVTTNIYLDEPLRKIGDYADYIDFKNSKVVRKNKEVDLTTLTFSGGGNSGQLWRVTLGDLAEGRELLATNYNYSTSTPNTMIEAQFTAPSTTVYFYRGENTTDTPTGNLVYHSSETVEETIELPNILTTKGTCVLSVETKIKPMYLEAVYKGKGQLQLMEEEDNEILNSILATDTDTQLNITNTEIVEILDEIIGG